MLQRRWIAVEKKYIATDHIVYDVWKVVVRYDRVAKKEGEAVVRKRGHEGPG